MSKEHSCRFNRDMTRAVLDGRKTMTRRPIKPQPPSREWFLKRSGQDIGFYKPREWEPGWRMSGSVGIARDEMGDQWPKDHFWYCPYGQAGDTFRLSEAVQVRAVDHERYSLLFEADLMHTERYGDPELIERIRGYKRGMLRGCTLPPAFCRSERWLIEEVRAERIQDITEEDARAEGLEDRAWMGPSQITLTNGCTIHGQSSKVFAALWQSIYGQDSWDRNDWVWVSKWKAVGDAS